MYTDPTKLLISFLHSNVSFFTSESHNSSLKHFEDIFKKRRKKTCFNQTKHVMVRMIDVMNGKYIFIYLVMAQFSIDGVGLTKPLTTSLNPPQVT